ncbi:MAG: CTP synthase ura7 [Chaenotheca gracillima]|nr:MAG: CTP synthase ura7 [Chaenotheca gracillima]
MTETQHHHQSGPFALPPPSFIGNPYNSTSRSSPPVRLAPISIPSAHSNVHYNWHNAPPPQYNNSQSFSPPGRRSAAPIESLLTTTSYAPPRSDTTYASHSRFEIPLRPEHASPSYAPPPDTERRISTHELRRDLVPYPPSDHRSSRGAENIYRGTAPSSAPIVPLTSNPLPAAPSQVSRDISSRFELRVRQQPLAARACGFGERDRRVIDPPPIVQLFAKDPETGEPDPNGLRYPFNVVHCTLWNENNSVDETALASQDHRMTRRLMGTLVSSPFSGTDENGEDGSFFCFPDLSCRTHGKYRLRFVMMHIETSTVPSNSFCPIVAQAVSDVFTVFTAKDFPGMRASTPLTKALKRQGCAISVKKGNERATNARIRDENSADEEGDEGSERSKRRRQG